MKKTIIPALAQIVLFTWLCLPSQSLAVHKAVSLEYTNGNISFKSGHVSVPVLIDFLSQSAGVHIYIVEAVPTQAIFLDLEMVPLERVLENVLRGYSYAVIYSGNHLPYFAPSNQEQLITAVIGESSSNAGNLSDHNRAASQKGQNQSLSSQTTGVGYRPAASPGITPHGTTFRMAVPRTTSVKPLMSDHTPTYHSNASVSSTPASYGSALRSASQNETSSAKQAYSENSHDTPTDSAASGSPSQNLSDSQLRAKRLEYHISQLEEYIGSGRAQSEYDRWNAIKDPKYVYNPWDELERKKAQLAALN